MLLNKRMQIFLIFLLLFSVTAFIQPKVTSADQYYIHEITYSPVHVTSGSNFTVTMSFTNTSGLDVVRLLICELSPEFKCEANAIIMVNEGNVFTGSFIVKYDAGTVFGFHFAISYTNGSYLEIPDSIDFLGINNIVEPVAGSFYFNITVEEPTSSSPGFLVSIGAISFVFLAVLWKSSRKHK